MFLRSFILPLSVLLVAAIVTVSLVYATTYNARCYPAREQWGKTGGDCVRNSNDNKCYGEFVFQQHIVVFSCDTAEAGSCTESTVMLNTVSGSQSVPCDADHASFWVPCKNPSSPTGVIGVDVIDLFRNLQIGGANYEKPCFST